MGKKILVSRSKYKEVEESYSADRLAERHMRRPFLHEGKLFISTGGSKAYQIVPERAFDGESHWYDEMTEEFTYHGMKAMKGKAVMVLQGPGIKFVLDETPVPTQASMF